MTTTKKKPVTDAQLVAACILYGHASRVRERTGDWTSADRTGNRLYKLCMRAAKEREAKQ